MDEVRNWLRSFGLQEYAHRFKEDGWEKLEDLFHIDEDDLKMCIHKPGHRKRFHLAVRETKATGVHPSVRIAELKDEDYSSHDDEIFDDPRAKAAEIWLQRNGLGQYFSNFKDDGWDILDVFTDMDEQDIQQCIDRPGHRKKFQLALKQCDSSNISQLTFQSNEITVQDIRQQRRDVENWLEGNNLEQYIDILEGEGWDTLDVLFELGETEEDLKRCIDKPGHRKRFQLAAISVQSGNIQTVSPKEKLPEERTDLHATREIDRVTFTHLQNKSIDVKHDLTTVRERVAPSKKERINMNYSNQKESSGMQGGSAKLEEEETTELRDSSNM